MRRIAVCYLLVLLGSTGCTAALASPLPSGAGATSEPSYPFASTPTLGPAPSAATTASAPKGWQSRVLYNLPDGSSGEVVGVGQDNTIYVLTYTPSFPASSIRLLAVKPDGSFATGWPEGGVSIPGLLLGAVLAPNGTVYIATTPAGSNLQSASALGINAVGSDGRILAGWPYTAAPAVHFAQDPFLVLNSVGSVCFIDGMPGDAGPPAAPKILDCLGVNGLPLPGWPYTSSQGLIDPAVGSDGTLYVDEVTSEPGVSPWPSRVLALDPAGKPKSTWSAYATAAPYSVEQIATGAGATYVALVDGKQRNYLTVLGPDGSILSDLEPLMPTGTAYGLTAAASQGWAYVATVGPRTDGKPGGMTKLSAFSDGGAQRAGYPITLDNAAHVLCSPEGEAWLFFEPETASSAGSLLAIAEPNGDYSAIQLPGVKALGRAAFDTSGNGFAVVRMSEGSAVEEIGRQRQ